MVLNLTGKIEKLKNSNKVFFLKERFLDHQGCTCWGYRYYSNLPLIRDR